MTKLFFILSLCISLLADTYPKDMTGKWAVDEVDMGELGKKMPEEKRQMLMMMIVESFKNGSFTLQPDHKCVVDARIPNLPKNNYWAYDPATGILTIKNNANDQRKLMQIKVTAKGKDTFFTMKEGVVLKVHKVAA